MTTTDIIFFWKKAKEVGFEITDFDTVETLYNAVYDALHYNSQEIFRDTDCEHLRYYIKDDALIFDYGVINPAYALNVSYLLKQFGFELYYNEETDSYKIFFRK